MDPSEEATDQNVVSSTENYFVTYTFTDRSHSSRVAQSIMKLCMEEQLFADVTVLVEGKEFQLHRLVLSAQSCFFRSMFASNLKEGHNRVIELKDVSASIFQLLVDYIYHGTVKLRLEQLQETYEVADMYQLTALFEECSRFLVRTVQVKNCLQIMWLADQHSDPSLYTAAKHCAKTHLSQLCDTEEFLNLPLRLLTDIITDGVPCSQNPTVAIKNWIHFNKEEREGFTEKLLSSLKSIDDEEEEEEEEDEDDDESVDEYEDYELEYEYSEPEYDFGHESEEEEEEEEEDAAAAEARNAAAARNNNDPEFQALLQRLREKRDEENRLNPWCFQDDPQWGPGEERPRPTPDPEGRLQNTNWCQCGQCSIMSEVEECVCCHELPAMERFFQTDPCVTQHEDFSRFVTSREILIPLLQFATKMTAAQFECKEHRHLRVAGYRKFTNLVYGFLGKEIGEKVHIYLIGKEESRTHSIAVSLHCAQDDSISVSGQNSLCHQITAACKHGADLYVVGGSIPRRMWKCNMETMDWERCAPLPRDRLQHTLVSVSSKDAIYSLGGKTLQDSLSNVVIYYRVQDNVWTETSQLEVSISGAAGVNLNGLIYLMGGVENDLDFFTKPSRLIQCFDTNTEKCHVKPYLLPFAGHMHAAVHKDLVFIIAQGDSLVCYNPLLDSFTRLCLPEVWNSRPSLWKIASCNGCIYLFRDHYKKGDASAFKLNPATSVVTVTSGTRFLLTNLQFLLA